MRNHNCSLFQELVPDAQQTWLLQACLLEKERASEAWNLWCNSVSSALSEFKNNYAFKTLAPLLNESLTQKGIEPPAEITTFLRMSYLQEKLRVQTIRACLSDVFKTLMDAGIPFLALKGVVLAELYYREKNLRHTHDLDLFIKSEALADTTARLKDQGIDPVRSERNRDGSAFFRHRSGFNIAIHTRLFSIPHYNPPVYAIWERARIIAIAGVDVPVLHHTDMLLHILGNAACSPNRNNLRWACDSVFILEQEEPDWKQFLQTSSESRLSLVSFILLSYLRNKMNAGIPTRVLDELRSQPDASTLASAESLLQGIRLGSGKTFRLFTIADHWYDHLLLLKWILAPHPRSTKWRQRIRYKWLIPLYYLYRPFRYLVSRLSGWLAWTFWIQGG